MVSHLYQDKETSTSSKTINYTNGEINKTSIAKVIIEDAEGNIVECN